MIYSHFIGRIVKNAENVVSNGKTFMSVRVAVDNFWNGKNETSFIQVQSGKENHMKLTKYLTKGRLILVEGTLSKPHAWISNKTGEPEVELRYAADSINFINSGKRQNDGEQNQAKDNSQAGGADDGLNTQDIAVAEPPASNMPFEPNPNDDLPF